MELKYSSFIDEVWSKFPALTKREPTDDSDLMNWSLDDYINAGYTNFKTGRKPLYRLSFMLEKYAMKNSTPLLATFESESLYKYVKDRYVEILKNVPKTWIVGNFNNPFLAQNLPDTVEVISCVGTNISDMWMVITKGEHGAFGLVAEDIGDGRFRGFFSISPMVIGKAVQTINETLRVNIDLSKNEWTSKHGSY